MTNDDIPAGYQLHVSSWENDGDAGHTLTWSGLTKEDCAFLIDFVSGFGGRHADGCDLGNDGATAEQLLGHFFKVLNRHPSISKDMRELLEGVIPAEEDDDDAADALYDILIERLLGYPAEEFYSSEYERFCRNYSDHKVYYFERPVKEVSAEFE